jgi:hypothetical protein
MKNPLFNIKSVITGNSKAIAGAETFLKVGARAGEETNSFGSATLILLIQKTGQ